MLKLLSSLFSVLVILTYHRASAQDVPTISPPSCLDVMLECNDALGDLIVLSVRNPIIHWPANDTAMSAYCTKLDDYRRCFEGHLKVVGPNCTSEELVLFGQFLAIQANYFKTTCITAKRREDALIRMNECYSLPAVNEGIFRTAFRTYLMVSQENNSKIKAAQCCAALYFRDTIYQVNQEECSEAITEEVHHMVQEMIGPAYHKDCGPVATYKKCFEQLPGDVQNIFKEAETADAPFFDPTTTVMPI